jgi:hypothetical protein
VIRISLVYFFSLLRLSIESIFCSFNSVSMFSKVYSMV